MTYLHLYNDHIQLTYGQTVCDYYGILNNSTNCGVAVALDVEKFWDMMIEAVDNGELSSPYSESSAYQ